MNRPVVGSFDRTGVIYGRAGNIEKSSQATASDGNSDRQSGINHFDAAC